MNLTAIISIVSLIAGLVGGGALTHLYHLAEVSSIKDKARDDVEKGRKKAEKVEAEARLQVEAARKDAEAVKAAAAAQLEASRRAVDAANVRAYKAAQQYEEWKRTQQPKIVTIEKEVTRVLEANPDWNRQLLPDGLRDALRDLPAQLGASEPDDAMRPVRAPASSGL